MTWGSFTLLLCVAMCLGVSVEGCYHNKPPGPPPGKGNGHPRGADRSPENPIMLELAEEFRTSRELRALEIRFYDMPIDEFMNVGLREMLQEYGHVDFMFIFDRDIDRLRDEGLIMPYPAHVIEQRPFKPGALDAMMLDGALYAMPLFIAREGLVKGVALSSRMERGLMSIVLDFSLFLSEPENLERLARAYGADPAVFLPDRPPEQDRPRREGRLPDRDRR